MNDFEKFVYDEVCTALADIDDDIVPDVYVLSFYVFDLDDDPRHPILQVGYNTRSRLSACTPAEGQAPGWPIASDLHEAKWNFAFWLQNELKFIGEPETQGAHLWEELLKAKGLWYSDEDEHADFDRCTPIAAEITAYFVAMCVGIAQALHASGVIKDRFLQSIPIVVHELEYYDQIASQTAAANPPGLTKEFVAWVSGLGNPSV
jgi:hypothetical protein